MESIKRDSLIQFSFLGLVTLTCGILFLEKIYVIGVLYAGEIALALTATVLLIFGKTNALTNRDLVVFLFLGLLMSAGYILSDINASTPKDDFLRAWGRNGLLVSNIFSLGVILSYNKSLLWWFVLGLAISLAIAQGVDGLNGYAWKFGYGQSAIMTSLLLGYFFPRLLTSLLLFIVGGISIYLDSRLLGATSFIISGYVFVFSAPRKKNYSSAREKVRVLIGLVAVITVTLLFLNITEKNFEDRRNKSNISRLAAIDISIKAISNSPLLGYGSWGHGTEEYANLLYQETRNELRGSGSINVQRGEVFLSHSQIFQAWMEGGILAAIFFIYFGYKLFQALKYIYVRGVSSINASLSLYFIIIASWNLVMSPYGSQHRLNIALAIAVICILRKENVGVRKR